MTYFIIVSALVLLSVLWDSTEDIRRKWELNRQQADN